MKLYLSSYRLGKDTSFLQNWINENGSEITIIPNAVDIFADSERKTAGILDKCKDLESLGFRTEILDLRNYFGKQEELSHFLKNKKAFYVIGGNAFVLNRAMKLSGFDNYLLSKVNDDNVLYSGFSAGICVLAQNLDGLSLVDNPEIDPYNSTITTINGIGILDYLPVPHYKSDHPESPAIDDVIEYLNQKRLSYRTLHDGDVIIDSTIKIGDTKNIRKI